MQRHGGPTGAKGGKGRSAFAGGKGTSSPTLKKRCNLTFSCIRGKGEREERISFPLVLWERGRVTLILHNLRREEKT